MLSSCDWTRMYTFQQEIAHLEAAILSDVVQNNVSILKQYRATIKYMQEQIQKMENKDKDYTK